MALTIPDASAEMILAAAEGVFYTHPTLDLATIAKYIRAPEDRAREALRAAVLLGFLREPSQGSHEPSEEALRLTVHSGSTERRILFRFRLECFAPFRLFKERVLCGDSPLESVDKVRLLHGIETPDPSKLKEIFQQWGAYANSLTPDPGGTTLVSPTGAQELPYLRAVGAAVENAELARVFIRKRVGDEHFARLPPEVVDNLSSALSRCNSRHDPKSDIAFAIGTAMEKVLSHIAASAQPTAVDLSGASGINTIADRLRAKGAITGKHVGLIHAIGALRNAADHAQDIEIQKTWSLTHDSLTDLALLSLDIIRSLFEWTTREFPVI